MALLLLFLLEGSHEKEKTVQLPVWVLTSNRPGCLDFSLQPILHLKSQDEVFSLCFSHTHRLRSDTSPPSAVSCFLSLPESQFNFGFSFALSIVSCGYAADPDTPRSQVVMRTAPEPLTALIVASSVIVITRRAEPWRRQWRLLRRRFISVQHSHCHDRF